MSEKTTEAGHPPISLLANSYNFQDLEKASIDAGKTKADERDGAFAKIAHDQALNKDVLKGQDAPSLPEESQFVEVDTEDGKKTMIVGAPEKEALEQRKELDAAAEGDATDTAPKSRRSRDTTEG